MKKKKQPSKPMSRQKMDMANQKLMKHLDELQFDSIEELNKYLEEHVMGKPIDDIFPAKKGRKSKVEKSEDLIYEAYDAEGEAGIKLAKEALALNPENVRAILFFADREPDVEKAADMYKKAAALAAKQLGPDFKKRYKSHFWGFVETRPYMQARLGYVNTLRVMNKHKETIKELKEMLKLNPNDNQGVRYILAPLLLAEKKYDDFYKLHNKYDEESTSWLYNYALFTYATEGPNQNANKSLLKAYKSNKHIIKFLTGEKEFKSHYYNYYSPGDLSEAEFYITGSIIAWVSHPDSVDWIVSFYESRKKQN